MVPQDHLLRQIDAAIDFHKVYFSQWGTKLNEINVLDIEMFYAHEKNTRNISGNTVAHYHANIHKALVDAVRLKLISHNPASDVERPKKDNFVASYYTADELMEMFPIFAGTKNGTTGSSGCLLWSAPQRSGGAEVDGHRLCK